MKKNLLVLLLVPAFITAADQGIQEKQQQLSSEAEQVYQIEAQKISLMLERCADQLTDPRMIELAIKLEKRLQYQVMEQAAAFAFVVAAGSYYLYRYLSK